MFIDIRFLPWALTVPVWQVQKRLRRGAGVNSEMEKGIVSLLSLFPPLISPPLSTPVAQAGLSVAVNV